jgi:hypothetical protein
MNAKSFLSASLCVLVLLFGVWVAIADAQVKGAIFTTNADGSFVNANVYEFKEEVYLNGGPRPNAPCTAAGLPDGDYVFQVTDPSGHELLSTDPIENRMVRISGGVISFNLGNHVTSLQVGQCNSITVQLVPFSDTPNSGGEYKVWMTQVFPVNYYSPGSGIHGFLPGYSKTDNFKVISENGGGEGGDSCPNCPPPSE